MATNVESVARPSSTGNKMSTYQNLEHVKLYRMVSSKTLLCIYRVRETAGLCEVAFSPQDFILYICFTARTLFLMMLLGGEFLTRQRFAIQKNICSTSLIIPNYTLILYTEVR